MNINYHTSWITFQNSQYDNFTASLGLTFDSQAEGPDSLIVYVNIGRRDSDMLKDITNLATAINNTFLRFPRFAVSDMAENLVPYLMPGRLSW